MTRWKWIYHDGATLRSIGSNPDGTLHNPNGYPEDIVRAAIVHAQKTEHARRSNAAIKAATTRRLRTEKRVYETAKRIANGEVFGPRAACVICGRGLDDAQSVQRGIGSECWQGVLGLLTRSNSDELAKNVTTQ